VAHPKQEHLATGALLLALLGLCPGQAIAVPSSRIDVAGFDALDEGKPDGTHVNTAGEVTAGMGAERIKGVDAPIVWSRARASDGTLFFGTGDKGKILALKGNRLRQVAQLDTVLVTALAVLPNGDLIAALMPGAEAKKQSKIVRVDPSSGKVRAFATLPTAHVWAMLYDAGEKKLYVATGGPGRIYQLSPSGGSPRVFFDPGEEHLLCLARDRLGNILAGSHTKAILYRIDRRGRGAAVHDFDGTEIRDLVITAEGSIVVAVNQFPPKTSGLPRYDRAQVGSSGTAIGKGKVKPKKVEATELRPGAKAGKGALFRIGVNGRLDELLALASGYFTALELDPSGVVWAGEGTKGRVYLVQKNRSVATAFDFPERQVLVLAVRGAQRYVGTGDAGAIYQITPRPKSGPAYVSKTFDAKFVATWGAIVPRATGDLRVLTRTGNTAKPDRTWSGWSLTLPKGSDRQLSRSPKGRYLQAKFLWSPPFTAALRSFSVYYRPSNQPARVTEIATSAKPSAKTTTPVPPHQISLTWKVINPDNDQLLYRLYYREETGATWRPLTREDEPLNKPTYVWNTESFADDTYRVKIVVSDETDNAVRYTLKREKISPPILVDNRKPEIVGITIRHPRITGFARDGYSAIESIAYSLDGGPWRLISPVDEVYDNPTEGFSFDLPQALSRGSHTIAIRARDAAGNLGVAHKRFTH
jgi:hypothetical protein